MTIMKKGESLGVLSIIVSLVLILFLFSVSAAEEKATPKTSQIDIRSFSFGTGMYAVSFALADLINKNSTWLRAKSVEGTGGPTVNMMTLAKHPEMRNKTVIFCDVLERQKMVKRLHPYKDIEYTNLREISGVSIGPLYLITLDKNIKTTQDLIGKKVSIHRAGRGISIDYTLLFKASGIWDKVKIEYLDMGPTKDALVDGMIDVGVQGASQVGRKVIPNPVFAELMATKDVYFVTVEEKAVKRVMDETGVPLVSVLTPAGAIAPNKPDRPILGLAKVLTWAADLTMDADIVYEITRIIYENADKFGTYHAFGKALTKETMTALPVVENEFHPGAIRFYKEKGIKIGR